MTHRAFTAFAASTAIKLLAFALVFALVQQARADVAVLVPPHAEQLANGELTEQATEELTRLLKLKGFDVISPGQAGPAAEAEQQRGAFPPSYDPLYCVSPECANEYRKLFDATFAVQLVIASREHRAASVSVILTESPKAYFAGVAPVEGRDVRTAVHAAFDAAREKQEEGAGPWLTVTGTPKGAMVSIDGAEYGRVPFTKRQIDSGLHKLEVRDDRHLVEQRTLNIPTQIDHVEQVTIALTPLDGVEVASEGAPGKRWHIHRSAWDYVLGGTIAAVGAVHLISGVYQKSKAGHCSQREDMQCVEHYSKAHGQRENLLIGLGAAGVAVGAAVIGLGPIGTLQVRAGADHALLQLGGKF